MPGFRAPQILPPPLNGVRRRHLVSVIVVQQYPRIDEWRTWQRGQRLSPRTIEARLARVEELARFTSADPEIATSQQCSAFMADVSDRRGYRGEPVKPATMSTYHSHLRAWFAWLVKMEYRDDDPMMRVPSPRKPKHKPRPVTDRELIAIFTVGTHRRTEMMMLLAAFQGLRCKEIAKIRGEHVNLLDGQLRVVDGKGGHDDTLPLHELVIKATRLGRERGDFPAKGFWFPTNAKGNAVHGGAGPVLARSVSSIIGEVFDRADVDGAAHRLRHWYATKLLKDGASTRLVQELLRHLSIQSTEIYTDVDPIERTRAIDRLRMPTLGDSEAGAA